MPAKRRPYVKKSRKTTYRRRTKRRITRVPKAIGPRNHVFTKAVYGKITANNIAQGTLWTESFCVNGLYDTEVAVGGNQPLYFDQYMAMYKNYRVYGCKVILKISAGTSTNNCFHPTVAIVPSSQSTPAYGSIFTAFQQRGSKYRNIVPASTSPTISSYYSISAILGRTRGEVRYDENLTGDSSNNPYTKAYVHVYFKNNDASAILPMTYEIKLIYYVKYFNLIDVAAS